MKIRIEGLPSELDAAVDRLRQVFFVQSVSRPYKNRNSEKCRVYVDAEMTTSSDPELTPSYHGKDCLGNGQHPGIECCCDECDYLMICFPAEDLMEE